MAKRPGKVGNRGYKIPAMYEPSVPKARSSKRYRVSDGLVMTEENHDKLVKRIKVRLDDAKDYRDIRVDRYAAIDRQYFGYIRLDEDDAQRQKDNLRGMPPKPVDQNLQLTAAQVEEAVTYLLSVMAPDTGLYSAVTSRNSQNLANGFVALMNNHAEDFGHYLALDKTFQHGMRYNFGAMLVKWREIETADPIREASGLTITNQKIEKSGNELLNLDPYNVILDPSCSPVECNKNGEFFATVDIITPFKMLKLERDGILFNVADMVRQDEEGNYRMKKGIESEYYKVHPTLNITNTAARGTSTDWKSWMSEGAQKDSQDGVEKIDYYTWVNPKDYGLGDEDELQIWHFVLVGCQRIAYAEKLTNVHGMLPICITVPNDGGLDQNDPSIAEKLLPFQLFASFLMNLHQKASLKALYGITFYDQDVFPNFNEVSMLMGKIPGKATRNGKSISDSVKQVNDAPHTDNVPRDVEMTNDMMQRILPTDMLSQVADLQRATEYQAAATVASGNKRQHRLAKIINAQLMVPCRFQQVYNIIQYMDVINITDDATGEETPVDPKMLLSLRLEFAISDGLKGMDKMLVISNIKDIINAILQSGEAIQRIDIVALLDYWSNILGEKYDFNAFKFKSEIDKLPVEQRDLAFQLLQQYAAAQQGTQGGQNGQPTQGNAGFGPGAGGVMPNQPLSPG